MLLPLATWGVYICFTIIGVPLNKERDCVAIGTAPWNLNWYNLFFCCFCLFGYFVMDQQADATKKQDHGEVCHLRVDTGWKVDEQFAHEGTHAKPNQQQTVLERCGRAWFLLWLVEERSVLAGCDQSHPFLAAVAKIDATDDGCEYPSEQYDGN